MFKTTFPIMAIVIALAVLVPARPAQAFHVGNVHVVVGAAAKEAYDDNITYVRDDAKRDFIMNATLSLAADYEGKTMSMSLSTYITQQLFARYSTYNNTSESLNFNLKKEFSWYDRIAMNDYFIHAEEPTSFDQAFGMASGRYGYYKNRYYFNYDRELTKQLAFAANYENDVDIFSREDLANSYLNNVGGGFNYSVTSKTILSALYGFAARSFDPGKSAFTNTGTFGARQYLTEQLYLDGKVGVDYINSFDERTYVKPLFFVSITDEMDKNMTSSLAFKKQFNANAYEQDVFDYWEFSGRFNRQILKRLGLNLTGFFGNGKYDNQNITDNLYGGYAGLAYEINEYLKATLGYSYAQTDSNTASRDYKKNTITAGITGEF